MSLFLSHFDSNNSPPALLFTADRFKFCVYEDGTCIWGRADNGVVQPQDEQEAMKSLALLMAEEKGHA